MHDVGHAHGPGPRREARRELADRIVHRLTSRAEELAAEYAQPGRVHAAVVDDLLDEVTALEIYRRFPSPSEMDHRRSLRESKSVSAQVDRHHPLLEECLFAFQDSRVLVCLSKITGTSDLIADTALHRSGLSLMERGDFLNPHLDNSHSNDRRLGRVLNLLYYVTPVWPLEYGGHLELWDQGPGGACRTIPSTFNRLVIMGTDRHAWHSVSPVIHDGRRCCVSNYFYSSTVGDHFHVTSFRGRPGQRVRDVLLRADGILRNGVRKLFRHGVVRNWHFYDRR
jgi:Rps23 Pro-64 3,4-dihydroxylase Tpa1-like proline 4-hydroxylase